MPLLPDHLGGLGVFSMLFVTESVCCAYSGTLLALLLSWACHCYAHACLGATTCISCVCPLCGRTIQKALPLKERVKDACSTICLAMPGGEAGGGRVLVRCMRSARRAQGS